MSVVGTAYHVLAVVAVVATIALAAFTGTEGHALAAGALAVIGGAIAGIWWRVGTVLNGGVGA